MQQINKDLFFSHTRKDMDVVLIHDFIKNSYWGNSRTLEEQKIALDNTMNFGLFHNDKQIAFARVMTDKVFFAYLLDVFVIDNYQGKGFSKILIDKILTHGPLKDIDKWILATKDAHTLYEKFGFEPIKNPTMLMEKMSERAKKIYN